MTKVDRQASEGEWRVITWTTRDGIKSVSAEMSRAEADALCSDIRAANPAWLRVEVEPA